MEGLVNPDPAFWSGRRVLLTGHTGFKGAWLGHWLRRLGAEVSGLGLEPPTPTGLWNRMGRPGGDESLADLRDSGALRRRLEAGRPEIVLHLAAQALVREGYRHPRETFEVNVMGLVDLFEAVRQDAGVKALVIVTSDKCYRDEGGGAAHKEGDALGGADPYSASKACAEMVVDAYRSSYLAAAGVAVASARAGNVIGGGDVASARLVPDCLTAFAAGQAVQLRNPLAVRPWQHVLEPLTGYLILAERLIREGQSVARAWNFAPPDSESWRVRKVVEHLARRWGDEAGWTLDAAAHPLETAELRVDGAAAARSLGWKLRMDTAQALDWTLDWERALSRGHRATDLCSEQIAAYEQADRTATP